MTQAESPAILSPSPSLSIYSSNHLSDIAARVIQQLRLQGDGPDNLDDDDDHPFLTQRKDDNRGDEEDEEEFTFVRQPQYTSPTPADQIFCDGRIRPAYTYPVFVIGREESDGGGPQGPKQAAVRLPLGKFLMEERELSSTSWCSSSEEGAEEEEEIEGAEPGSYCMWRPENTGPVKGQNTCRKSRSSQRWRFRNYFVLKRSTSDGHKDSFVILRRSKKGPGGGQN